MPSHLLTPPNAVSLEESWTDCNERALVLARDEQWEAAAELWATALSQAPAFAMEPDTHALLLSNLAQARFRCGDIAGALELGHRSLAARLLCCESESDAPMARAQSDLGVYLAAAGQSDDAEAVLEKARESLESQFGDEDERLISVLENQARLALMTHHPAIAEPKLLRLHALLDSLGNDPSRIDALIARVAASRGATQLPDTDILPAHEPNESSPSEEGAFAVLEPDARPLPAPDVFSQIMDDEFDLIDDATHTPMSSPSAQSIRSEGLIEPGLHSTPSWTAKTNPLGFEVQYGIPSDESYAVPPHTLRDT